jgi:predicted enzyme related to lactoylglutathione lyase
MLHNNRLHGDRFSAALGFYRDALGLDFEFNAGPKLAFLNADGVRIMLSTPQGSGTIGANSIFYFKVSDIEAVHSSIVARAVVMGVRVQYVNNTQQSLRFQGTFGSAFYRS